MIESCSIGREENKEEEKKRTERVPTLVQASPEHSRKKGGNIRRREDMCSSDQRAVAQFGYFYDLGSHASVFSVRNTSDELTQ